VGIGASPCQQTKCIMPNLSRIAAEQILFCILRMDLYSLLITFQMVGHFVLTRIKRNQMHRLIGTQLLETKCQSQNCSASSPVGLCMTEYFI